MQEQRIPEGLCQCGCGQKTRIAPRSHAHKDWIKGKPLKYVRFHKARAQQKGYVVDPLTGCWPAEGRDNGQGYVSIRRNGRTFLAHRWYYEQAKGPIPEGLQLDHLCRNRACVNPDHLEPVTHLENQHRGLLTKLTDAEILEIVTSGATAAQVVEHYGISKVYAYALLGHRDRRARRVLAESASDERPAS